MDKKIIVDRIKELMDEKHVKAYDLKNAGVYAPIEQWKKNAQRDKNRTPSLRSIEKICDYFGISLSYFFAFDYDTQRNIRTKELSNELEKLSDDQLRIIEAIIKEFINK